MAEANRYVAPCKFAAATAAAVAACDLLDGVKDGVLEDPSRCKFDPAILTRFQPAACEAITEADAAVIRQIWEGPKRRDGSFLWYGLPRGAEIGALHRTGGSPLTGQPSGITLDWWRYFLKQDPGWNWSSVTRAHYEQLWDQSVEEFSPVFASDNPDLTAFRERGGKAIVWHGWADQLIYAQGTIDYYERVRARMRDRTPDVLRLFMAPGVAHCGGGPGPAPVGQFDSLVKWVEQGIAPETLSAEGKGPDGMTRTRPLCPYPLVARYRGQGSTNEAANFSCGPGF
jgi:Tannase and feruloyl esterase